MEKYNLLLELFTHITDAEKAIRTFTKEEYAKNADLYAVYFKLSEASNLVLTGMREELNKMVEEEKENYNIA